MHILITSGGTRIPIDEVRSITNMSKGTFGSRIALAALKRGHSVHFIYARDSKRPFDLEVHNYLSIFEIMRTAIISIYYRLRYASRLTYQEYVTFTDYAKILDDAIKCYDLDAVVLAAAVSDYGVTDPVKGKIRSSEQMSINLKPLPKLISSIREKVGLRVKVVGFKLLVGSKEDELIAVAKTSLKDNKLDLVVANDLRDIKMGQHSVIIVKKCIEGGDPSIYGNRQSGNDPLQLATCVIRHIEELW